MNHSPNSREAVVVDSKREVLAEEVVAAVATKKVVSTVATVAAASTGIIKKRPECNHIEILPAMAGRIF
jgi:hypothetical protein